MNRICLSSIALLLLTPLAAQDRSRLLQPKAAVEAGPRSASALRAQFAAPAPNWRPMPLWVWNDRMEAPLLKQQLAGLKQAGMGGAFVHPRPGLLTEYLSQEWFSLWGESLNEAKRLGIGLHIYDENSYPSGFAGGHVPARDPETAGTAGVAQLMNADARINWTDPMLVSAFAVSGEPRGTVGTLRRLDRGEKPGPGEWGLIQVRIERVEPRPFTANFPYVDLTHPRTVPLFLELTHEQYRKRFGAEFGKTIRMVFTDEPELPRKGASIPLSMRILTEFQRRYGYDLASSIPSLFWNTGDYRKVRFDYWQIMHDLLEERFFSPIYEWCDQAGVHFTGHWWEHVWPEPFITPADASMYAYEHIPGIDVLWTPKLRETGAQPDLLLAIRQVASAARQLGRPRVLSEAYGGNGSDATPEYFKLAGDWQIVHGVNLINQHLADYSIHGARKRDYPQTFSPASPWWPYIEKHSTHTARLSLAMSSGEARPRILVLTPTTAGFVRARVGAAGELAPLRESYTSLIQFLADHQVDFDTADEHILGWFGRVEQQRLIVGKASYDIVVWPEQMDNIRSSAARILDAFTRARGRVALLGSPASLVDGRPSNLISALASSWNKAASHQALLALLHQWAPPRIEWKTQPPQGIGFAERFLEGGERLLLLTNSGPRAFTSEAAFEGGGAERWDSVDGSIAPAGSARNGKVTLNVHLEPAASLLLLIGPKPSGASPAPQGAPRPLPSTTWRITAEQGNVAVLDYCSLSTGGRQWNQLHFTAAADAIYRAHGWPMNPWDRAVQYRQTHLETKPEAGGGFKAGFAFEVADAAALSGLELMVESGDRYRVTLNGTPVTFPNPGVWVDRRMRLASIEKAARVGINRVEVAAENFDVEMELEAVMLRGAFRALPANAGFKLAAPTQLAFGSWSGQGMPFYAHAVRYETDIETAAGRLTVELPQFSGSAAEVLVDGHSAGTILWRPYALSVPVPAGRHTVAIRVFGTGWNLFGPFHYNGDRNNLIPGPGATPSNAPPRQPAGAAYRVVEYGLLAEPRLSLVK